MRRGPFHRLKGFCHLALPAAVAALSAVLLSGGSLRPAQKEGGHAGLLCLDCHTMHYSERGDIPPGSDPGGPFEELILTQTINRLCLSCHDGRHPDAPNVNDPAGYVSAAGAFTSNGIVIERNRHSLGSGDPPPGYAGGSWTDVLTCVSCHDPHENRNYRNLVEHPGNGDMISVTSMVGPVYDGSSAVQEIEGEPMTTRYSADNIHYRRSVAGGKVYGLSAWCGGCHTNFHGTGGSEQMGGSPAGDVGPGSEWIRHPVRDVTMAEAFANGNLESDNWFARLASRVPAVSPTEIPGSNTGSDNEVFCGSCHRAHGSDHRSTLIYDDDRTADPGDGLRMSETCTQCHFGPGYMASPHGDEADGVERVWTDPPSVGECSQCHFMHASVDGAHTGGPYDHALYQDNTNGLCFDPSGQGGCHRDMPSGYPAQETDRMPEGSEHAGYFEANSGGYKINGLNYRRRWPGMIVYTDQRTFGSGRFFSPHRNDMDMPVRDSQGRGLCVNCHSPHGSGNPFDMLKAAHMAIGGAGEVNPPDNYELCFGCHGPDGPVGMDQENRLIADFYDPRINNDETAGHQIRLSDDSAISWPSHIQRGDKLPCYDCHNAHGSEGNDGVRPNGFLISDQREGWSGLTDTLNDPEQTRRFCFGCHISSDGVPGSKSVEGILMNAIPRKVPGHSSNGSRSCYDCHGRDYSSPGGYNVHHPSEGDGGAFGSKEIEFEGR